MTRLGHAVFNTTNLSGLAAISLSWGLGATYGVAAFIFAVLIGTYNKYMGLRAAETENPVPVSQNRFLRELSDPSITAKVLMVAASINCIEAAVKTFTGSDDMFLYHLMTAMAWMFGVLGDDALRRNDKTNFSAAMAEKMKTGLRGHMAAAVRNPSFYYLACNIFISTATVTKNIHGVDTAQIIINAFIILLSLFGMGYAINKVWQVSQAGALGATIHDGVINYINVAVNSGVGILCILTQNWPVFFSQILFCIANVKALYETRNALHREQTGRF